MRDIMPEDQEYFFRIEKTVRAFAESYGFSRIDLPIIESEELFVRGTGLGTDIVEKEMYAFRIKGGDRLALRPEFTPGMARTYIENGMINLSQPVKLYTSGSLFRHENPQKGRYREHHQFNFDIFGGADAALDAEVIYIFRLILENLGLNNISTHINSVGCGVCRLTFRSSLLSYYRGRSKKLCKDCRGRLKSNPLRLLDCKEEKCGQLKKNAPQIVDNLCPECHSHFKGVLEFLDEIGIPYFLDTHLVRGLDYYTRTVFEFIPKTTESEAGSLRQTSVGGGGRYDGLVERLGGKYTPAVGCGGGVERIVSLMKEQEVKMPKPKSPAVFLIQLGDFAKKKSFKIFEDLRKAGIFAAEAFGKSSMKAQLKSADKSGASTTLILGQKEAIDGNIILRDMKSGVQEIISVDKLIIKVKKTLKTK